jgi:hypothetical protein
MIVPILIHGFVSNIIAPIPAVDTLERFIDQLGVRPGPRKFQQFGDALRLRAAPPIYAQEKLGDDAIAYVKFFDPCGSWTWFATEWDGDDEAFGLVIGHEIELGYFSLREMSEVKGRMGIGIEIDVHFRPTPLSKIREKYRG